MRPPFQPQDRRILIDALGEVPDFRTERGRYVLVNKILENYPDVNKALGFLNWEGAPLVVADDLIRRLEGHEVAPGVPALGLIAQAIEPMTGDHKDKIADLRRRMRWGGELLSSPANDWNDARPAAEIVKERIIGENTLHPMYYLRRALRAAEAVVRVDKKGIADGTGFLVSPDLMMTNHHVIANEQEAQTAQAVFFYEVRDPETDGQDSLRREVTARPAKDALLYTNEELDVTLLRLMGCPPAPVYLRVRPAIVEQNARVMIIQHPGGFPKQISLQNNLVAFANERIVQYYTSTQAGSSGSPVLDNDFTVVAIHHSWVHNEAWDGADVRLANPKQMLDRQFRNQGASMVAVVKDLEANAPALLKELTISPK